MCRHHQYQLLIIFFVSIPRITVSSRLDQEGSAVSVSILDRENEFIWFPGLCSYEILLLFYDIPYDTLVMET